MKILKLLCSAFFLIVSFNTNAQIVLQTYVSGLSQPVDITHAGDDRMFIVERAGRIRIVDNGTLLATPFLNISSSVNNNPNERGLLGLAFHPDYENNGYFYVYYTRSDGDSRISRFSVANDPNTADPGSEMILMEVDQPFWNHNGGCLKFDQDGYLYIGLGDGGSGGDPGNRAQNPQNLLGKMLRIDVDNGTPYGIPASNPFVGNDDVLDEIWALGLRNPWRFSFDSETGDLWIGDVGQNVIEEIDFQPANSPGGENYGWRCYEGNTPYNTSGCGTIGDYKAPAYDYNRVTNDNCSVTGGFVYRGCDNPDFVGHYIYTDYCTGIFWSIVPDGQGGWTNTQVGNFPGYDISSFGEDVDGELYAARLTQGIIYKVSSTTAITVEIEADVNTLSAPQGYTAYQWYLDGQPINGATGQTYDAANDGVYTVEVISDNDCTYLSEEYSHSAVGIHNILALEKFQLNPNPVDDDLEVSIFVNEPTTLTLKLMDLDGKTIINEDIDVQASITKILNLEKLPPAVYFISLESAGGRVVERIVKK